MRSEPVTRSSTTTSGTPTTRSPRSSSRPGPCGIGAGGGRVQTGAAPQIPLAGRQGVHAPLDELKERIADVLDSGRFILGPQVEAFMARPRRSRGARIGVANGRTRSCSPWTHSGSGPAMRFVCPSFTFADAESIARRGRTRLRGDRPEDAESRPRGRAGQDHGEDEGDHPRPPVRPAGDDRLRPARPSRRAQAFGARRRRPEGHRLHLQLLPDEESSRSATAGSSRPR